VPVTKEESLASDTATIKEGATVKLSDEVRKFCVSSEALLSAIAMNRPLTPDEAQLIQHYCQEVGKTIESRLPQN
jgi:hypothetical protein